MEPKAHIIEQATRMFLTDGLKAVRMDDIAAALGISKRTIYELFDSREGLISQCIDYQMAHEEQTMTAMVAESGADNVLDEVWIIIKHGQRFRKQNKTLMDSLWKFYPNLYAAALEKHFARVMQLMEEMFRRGIRQGLFMPDLNMDYFSEVSASFLYGIARIETSAYSKEMEDMTNPTAFLYMIMLFFRGITTEKGRRYMDDNIMGQVKTMGNDK